MNDMLVTIKSAGRRYRVIFRGGIFRPTYAGTFPTMRQALEFAASKKLISGRQPAKNRKEIENEN